MYLIHVETHAAAVGTRRNRPWDKSLFRFLRTLSEGEISAWWNG